MGIAAIASLGVLALHLITTQRPPVAMLPTARFVPGSDARAAARAARPTDVLLLLLRMMALLLLGAAFAHPLFRPGGAETLRIVVVDRSLSAGPDAVDSARALVRSGDTLLVLDSAARGSLSEALVAARHAARALAARADSIDLVVVSPVTRDEVDAATLMLVKGWPGRVRLVRTNAEEREPVAISLVSADANDDLAPVVAALNGSAPASRAVRLIRSPATAGDSARARSGAAVVEWRRIEGGAAVRAEGVWAGSTTLVAPLARLVIPAAGRAVARWSDGTAAAIESPIGTGCLRSVAIGSPAAGDVTLQPAFQAVAAELLAPCGGLMSGLLAPDSIAGAFSRIGVPAAAAAFEDQSSPSRLAPWLIAGALLLLLVEWWARRARTVAAV
jgi:hypothetical protein